MKKAIVLFSGGLDSTTCLALASQNFSCYALSFIYGQKHSVEIENAKIIAKKYQVAEHKILNLSLDQIGGSSLTDRNLVVPDYQPSDQIPNTYVPARNTIFLSYALAFGEVIGAYDIFIGANYIDYSGYPDCRPDYFKAFEKLASLASRVGIEQKQNFKIHTPILTMNKAQIIQQGLKLKIDYSLTISCYRANSEGQACGACDSCAYRRKGFMEAGVIDPTRYSE